jgi:hypothetical protein
MMNRRQQHRAWRTGQDREPRKFEQLPSTGPRKPHGLGARVVSICPVRLMSGVRSNVSRLEEALAELMGHAHNAVEH